jgi:hypothetical protein
MSEEHKKKISEALKGKKKSDAARLHMSIAKAGKTQSAATKLKHSFAMKRVWDNPEFRESRIKSMVIAQNDTEQKQTTSLRMKELWKSKEHRDKVIPKLKGHTMSEQGKQSVSASKEGVPKTEDEKIKISESLKEYFKDPAVREEMSNRSKIIWKDPVVKEKLIKSQRECHANPEYRLKQSTTRKRLMKENLALKQIVLDSIKKAQQMNTGEKHYNFKGCISYEPYCKLFTPEFKNRVRAFYGYKCTLCGGVSPRRALNVHHCTYNKMQCCDETKPLFAALCDHCHGKTNGDREEYEKQLTQIINERYGGKCYYTFEEYEKLNGGK